MSQIARTVTTIAIVLVSFGAAHAQRLKPQLEGTVNINTASPEELRLLPGVGPAKVRDIIAYREKRAFRSVAELARIRGIGPKMVRRLRPHLSVTGATTFQRVIRAPAAPDMVSGAAVLAPPPAPARAPGAAEPARSPSAQAGHGPTTSAPRDAGAPDR